MNSTLNGLSLSQSPLLCIKCARRFDFVLASAFVLRQHNFSSYHRLLNPRFKKSIQSESETSVKTKKARGRPKKDVLAGQNDTNLVLEEKPKRKRGRPRKSETAVNDEANSPPQYQSVAEGRQPENAAVLSSILPKDSATNAAPLPSNITLSKTSESTDPTTSRKTKAARTSNADSSTSAAPTKEAWQIRKAAISANLASESWNPRNKLSPDTMAAIRTLHEKYPEQFTLPMLHKHFGVSFEAIRRILKSSWQPNEKEDVGRRRRWEKRGKEIWQHLSDDGHKPPKKWRELGVGEAKEEEDGVPRWKRVEWRRRSLWWEREVEQRALGAESKESDGMRPS